MEKSKKTTTLVERDEIADRVLEKIGPVMATLDAAEANLLAEILKPPDGIKAFLATKPDKKKIATAINTLKARLDESANGQPKDQKLTPLKVVSAATTPTKPND